MNLETFVAIAGLNRLSRRPLDKPLHKLSPLERALVFSCLKALRPDLSNSAMNQHTTWGDAEHWLADTVVPPAPSLNLESRVVLRPFRPDDLWGLYNASLSPSGLYRWRYRGRTVSPEVFANDLWNGVLCQFMVDDRDTDECLGLVVAYNADAANGHCYFGVQRITTESVAYGLLEACCIFISYLFASFTFRRIYAEILSHNKFLGTSILSLKLAECVALYPDHQFGPTGYEDLCVYMFARDVWTNFADGLWSAIRTPLDATRADCGVAQRLDSSDNEARSDGIP